MKIKINTQDEHKVIKIFKNLDAFREIPETYVDRSQIGGVLSVISRILILFLIRREFAYYLDSNLVFKFKPDVDPHNELTMHVDLTIAMPCVNIEADIVDSTNDPMYKFGELSKEETWWDLCPKQRQYFDHYREVNSLLREEYHSIADVLFRDIVVSDGGKVQVALPKRSVKPTKPFDACRIYGTLLLNKVAGNLHITAGRSLQLPQGHIHVSSIFDDIQYNFTHRILRFGFGDLSLGLVQPLEGDETITHEPTTIIQYFIDVVPTEIHGLLSTINTFQYSVKSNVRMIDHNKGSHGMPAIYFKYDMAALKVIVRQDRDNPVQFFIRLCSIIAGVVVVSGFVNSFINKIHDIYLKIIKRVSPEAAHYMQLSSDQNSATPPAVTTNLPSKPPSIPINNYLLANANQMSETQISLAIKTGQ